MRVHRTPYTAGPKHTHLQQHTQIHAENKQLSRYCRANARENVIFKESKKLQVIYDRALWSSALIHTNEYVLSFTEKMITNNFLKISSCRIRLARTFVSATYVYSHLFVCSPDAYMCMCNVYTRQLVKCHTPNMEAEEIQVLSVHFRYSTQYQYLITLPFAFFRIIPLTTTDMCSEKSIPE